jgi:hypothetical protein
MTKEIAFYLMGNGVTVYYKGSETKVAHINPDREITFYTDPGVANVIKVEEYARTANPSISSSQHTPVFNKKAWRLESKVTSTYETWVTASDVREANKIASHIDGDDWDLIEEGHRILNHLS